MSLIEKIDAEIIKLPKETDTELARYYYVEGCKDTYEKVKRIILSEQKKPCKNTFDGFGNPITLTKGDKIRESNESLA